MESRVKLRSPFYHRIIFSFCSLKFSRKLNTKLSSVFYSQTGIPKRNNQLLPLKASCVERYARERRPLSPFTAEMSTWSFNKALCLYFLWLYDSTCQRKWKGSQLSCALLDRGSAFLKAFRSWMGSREAARIREEEILFFVLLKWRNGLFLWISWCKLFLVKSISVHEFSEERNIYIGWEFRSGNQVQRKVPVDILRLCS